MSLQHSNQPKLAKSRNALEILARSYLKPWSYAQISVAKDKLVQPLCDYAVLMDSTLLLIFEEAGSHIEVSADTAKQKFQEVKAQRLEALTQRIDSAKTLYAQGMQLLTGSESKPIDTQSSEEVLFIGVSSIDFMQDTQHMVIKHHFTQTGGRLIFSALDLASLISQLTTMPDLKAFLRYLAEHQPDTKPLDSLQNFIAQGHAISHASNVEALLVNMGLKQQLDPIFTVTDPDKQSRNFEKMTKNAKFWEYILDTYAGMMNTDQLHNENSSHLRLLSAMINESVASRHQMVRMIAEYMQAPAEVKKDGYLINQRSYTKPSRHYAFMFYAEDPASESHRSKAKDRLVRIAAGINAAFQDHPLDEIIVIGMIDVDGKLATDVFYTIGKPVAPTQTSPGPALEPVTKPKTLSQRSDNKTSVSLYMGDSSAGAHRNTACPCGSGKRFKDCHGKNAAGMKL